MKNIVLISAQPDHQYFLWQLEVQLYNIYIERKMECRYHILLSYEHEVSSIFDSLQEKYPLISLFYYKDQRAVKNYVPAIQIHLLYQHFLNLPQLVEEVLFLIDSDICFTQDLLLHDSMVSDDINYISDTTSYLNPKYLDSKGNTLLSSMCSIIQVDEDVVRSTKDHHGGAQYLLKNIDASFWLKVEQDCYKLYKYLTGSIPVHRDEWSKRSSVNDIVEYHPVQAWTASMWSILYNFIYFNREFKISKELDFCWPNNDIEKWESKPIFHNAGVTSFNEKLFYKGGFLNTRPSFNLNDLDQSKCSYKYAEIVKKALEV